MSEKLPIRIFTDGMTRGFKSRRDDGIRMRLQKSHRILRCWLAEQDHAQRGLLPRACIAVDTHFLRREAFADPQSYGHGRNELIRSAKAAMSQGKNRIDIVFLNANCRPCDLFERHMVIGVAPRLVVGNVPVLAPAAHRYVDWRLRNGGSHVFGTRWRQPETLVPGNFQLRSDISVEMLLH